MPTKINTRQLDGTILHKKQILISIAIPSGQNFIVLDVDGYQAPPDKASVQQVPVIGGNTHYGVVVAPTAVIGVFALNIIPELNVLTPKNIVTLRDATTHTPLMSSGREIHGLLQCSTLVNNGDHFDNITKRVQISFVRQNAAGNAYEAVPIVDIENLSFNYEYIVRFTYDELDDERLSTIFQEPFQGGGGTGAQGPQGSPGVTGPAGAPQGSPGVTGPQGPQGIQGATGPTGPQGPQGIQGATGATGPTGPQGQQGIQGATGLQGPQGQQGVQGVTGTTGPQGQQGIQGATGPTGPQGPQGIQGSTGPTGPQGLQGPAGPTGSVGATGSQGLQGSPGATGATGPQGPQGIQGVTGPTGPAGIQGNQGAPGINAYSTTEGFTQPAVGNAIPVQVPSGQWMQIGQYVFIPSGGYYQVASGSVPTFSLKNLGYSGVNIPVGSTISPAFVSPGGVAGATGVTGPTGPQGQQGTTGPTGPQGPQGIQGATGPTGPQGPQGIQGITGVTGPTGPQGQQGIQGVTGPQGPQGIQGATGPTGPAGNDGSQGSQGSPGVTGVPGINAYSTTEGFTQPAVGNAIPIRVPSGQWMQIGQYVFIPSGGYYQVASGSVPTFSLKNLGYSGVNLPVGSTISPAFISPGGIAGTTGATGPTGPAGPQGIQGATGPTGPQGQQGIQGVTGPTGPQGPQGIQGSTGPTGPQGNQGSPGVTGAPGINAYSTSAGFTQPAVGAAIAIQVPSGQWLQIGQSVFIPSGGYYQVASGSVPTFSLKNLGYSGANIPVGSLVSAAFVSPAGIAGFTGVTGPQGVQGIQGATGPTGPQGQQGIQGATGPTGPQGQQGTQGATGPTGPQGQQGIQGATGPTGPQGPQGIQGTTGPTGPQGPQGIQGSTGPTGPQGQQGAQGITGPTGAPGINAYSTTEGFTQPAVGDAIKVQVPSGQWMQIGQYVFIPSGGYYQVASGSVPTFSLQNLGYSGVNIPVGSVISSAFVSPGGIAGTTGATGPTGPQGPQGIQGVTGATGPQGQQGVQGTTGPTGPQGPQGIQGATGPTGPQGPQGIQGATGPTGPGGAQGSQGSPGITGVPGINAYSTTEGFTQPAVGNVIPIKVPSGQWMQVGQYVFIPSGGYYVVASGSVPTFSLKNLGYSGVNIPVGSTVAAAFISPGGVAGATGATGPQGATGPTGPQGPQGIQGATGPTGPQGQQGVQGATGPTGPAGPQGQQGVTGPTGPQGQQGAQGTTGPTGAPGINAYSTTEGFTQPAVGNAIPIQVPSGQWMQVGQYVFIPSGGYYQVASGSVPTFSIKNLGYSGVNLPVGSVISSAFVSPGGVAGTTGATGPQGIQGATGPTGPQGPQGIQGATGPTGPAGPQGQQGATGPTGPQGAQGIQGSTGPTGPQGQQGIQGATGPTGPQGQQGIQGITGATGPQGPQGATGLPGANSLFFLDGGISIGAFQNVNLLGLLDGQTAANNTLNITAAIPTTVASGYVSPVLSIHVLGDNFRAAPSGSSFLDTYLVASGATGGWTGLDGHLLQFGYSTVGFSGWIDVTNSTIQAGQMFIVGFTGPRGNATGYLPTGAFANKTGQVVQMNSNAPGASYTFNIPTTGAQVMVNGQNAISQNFEYVYDSLNGGWRKPQTLAYYSNLKTANYTVNVNDEVIGIGRLTSAITITLPPNPSIGDTYAVKDVIGTITNFNVTISGNGINVDGSATFVMVKPFSSYYFGYNGTQWNVLNDYGGATGGVVVFNNNTLLGSFGNINLVGNLIGTTGPSNTLNVNTLNDFAIFGLTGSNAALAGYASGAMVQWNNNIITPTGGAIGHTTIGTAAGWVTVQKAAWYEVDYSINFTGVGSGINQLMAQCYLGATGGNQGFGFGSGTTVPQSVALATIASGAGTLSQSFIVAIPSGYSIETYVSKLPGANPSGIAYSPTGSKFSIKTRG